MASDIRTAVSQVSNLDCPSPIASATVVAGGDAVSDMKKGNISGKMSRNSSSGEEDGLGNLIIDTDEDADKSNKEIKPYYGFQDGKAERKSPARNNNNNNSVGRSLCGNKHSDSIESNLNKTLSPNISSKLTFSQTAGSGQSGKIGKTKSKKSVKSNKSHTQSNTASNSTSAATSSSSSAAGPFINALDTDSTRNHNFDLKPNLPRNCSSPDENIGKKSKSNKSKSHHKKHNKHSEKNNSSNNGGKSDNTAEKIKSKSKHGANSVPSASALSASAFSSGRDASSRSPNSLSTLAVPDKNNGVPFINAKATFSEPATAQSTPPKPRQSTSQGRLPARTALAVSTTGNGAKITHACNQRALNDIETPSQNQHVRKKNKKNQLVASTSASSSAHDASEQHCCHSSSVGNSGKRERSAANITGITGNEIAKAKKMKFDSDGKSASSTKIHTSSAENIPRVLSQFSVAGSSAETNSNLFGASRSTAGMRTKTGENAQGSTGNSFSDSAAKTVAHRVFAPSSQFAQPMPRFSVLSSAEYANSYRSSSDASKQGAGTSEVKACEKPSTAAASQRSVGTITCTSDIGVMTEPDALGPCEPGTSVHLDGIVWHETNTGVLVVNVTWRNRTYVGTLLDATKHDWAPPRFSDSDLDIELRGKTSRPKRSRGGQNDSNRKGRSRNAQSNDDLKNSPSAAAKRRNKNSESEPVAPDDNASTPKSSVKRLRLTPSRGAKEQAQQPSADDVKTESNGGSTSSSCSSPVFLECSHPKCNKKFKLVSGLKYHQAHAHGESNEEEQKNEETETSSPEERLPNTALSAAEAAAAVDEEEEPKSPKEPKKKIPTYENENHSSKPVFRTADNFPLLASAALASIKEKTELPEPRTEQTSVPSTQASIIYPHIPIIPSSTALPTSAYPSPPIPIEGNERSREYIIASNSPNDDIEQAQAVKTLLLQLQDKDDIQLPGLSSYSQDSPHPTLSLVSRPISSQDIPPPHSAPANPNRSYPSYVPPANNPGILASTHVTSSVISQPPFVSSASITGSFVQPSIPSFSRIPTASNLVPSTVSSHEMLHGTTEHLQDLHPKYPSSTLPKENYTVSVSEVANSSGTKTYKGITVPVPVDPDRSLPSVYSGSAAESFNFSKKVKRKKRDGGKFENSPESPQVIEGAFIPHQHPPRFHQSSESISPNRIGAPLQSIKPQPPTMDPPGSYDANRPILRQQLATVSRKVHGIISPVSSSQSGNITVTGTFHPYPDPHKPQTAVSAQAQDRLRSSRPSSPATNSSNKNNNNKPPERSGGGRPQGPSSVPKPRPSSAHAVSPQGEKLYRDHENLPRATGPEFTSHQVREPPLSQMQSHVNSTINNVYSKTLSEPGKVSAATSPITANQRPRDSPIPVAKLGFDHRHSVVSDEVKNPPPKTLSIPNEIRPDHDVLLEAQKNVSSPRPKPVTEVRHPLASNQHAAYLSQVAQMLQLGGMSFINPMDAATYQQIAMAQFMAAEPQMREQYDRMIQQQRLQQQQQAEKHILSESNEKDGVKQIETEQQMINWPQHSKQTVASSPSVQHQVSKERPSSSASLLSHSACKAPQSVSYSTPLQAPTRCRSVAPSNPSVDPSRPHHVRSESLDRGKSNLREEKRVLKTEASASIKTEKSPEKSGGNFPPSVGARTPPTATSGHQSFYSPYQQVFDPTRPPYPGVPHYSPYPQGYMFPPGGQILHPPTPWIQGNQQVPVSGKQSPPLKQTKEAVPPNKFRPPSQEDIKPKEYPPYPTKDARSREVAELPTERKYSPSPDPKSAISSTPSSRKSVVGSAVSSELPTQMHHHTHHHIHEGVIIRPQYYPAPTVIGPDVSYPVPFQKPCCVVEWLELCFVAPMVVCSNHWMAVLLRPL